MTDSALDRARGALLGQAVGDALGTTYEFRRIEQPDYPALATSPATDVVGDGPFRLPAGAITDDTQLAVCLARSLAEKGGFDPADVAERYVAWQDEAFDIGGQTRSSLRAIEKTGSTAGGMIAWRESAYQGAGNGSLMRTTPIAIALGFVQPSGSTETETPDVLARAHRIVAVIDASIADSMLTHADPRCMLACAAHNVAIATVLDASEPDALARGRAMIAAARDAVDEGARRLTALWTAGVSSADAGDVTLQSIDVEIGDVDDAELALVDQARVELLHDLEMALADDPLVYGEEHEDMHIHERAGFVRLAFRLAFWHAVHTPAWKASVVDVASRGGDADTNAAIAGALIGGRDGASAIPQEWIERVLAARQPGSDEWADAHHPKHLLALVQT
ncbi:MAG: ADP-ribosylglycohydrolase family protein [Kofleriaceae bacterium]